MHIAARCPGTVPELPICPKAPGSALYASIVLSLGSWGGRIYDLVKVHIAAYVSSQETRMLDCTVKPVLSGHAGDQKFWPFNTGDL